MWADMTVLFEWATNMQDTLEQRSIATSHQLKASKPYCFFRKLAIRQDTASSPSCYSVVTLFTLKPRSNSFSLGHQYGFRAGFAPRAPAK